MMNFDLVGAVPSTWNKFFFMNCDVCANRNRLKYLLEVHFVVGYLGEFGRVEIKEFYTTKRV